MQGLVQSDYFLAKDAQRACLFVFALLYKCLLDYSYVIVLEPVFGYMGFGLDFSAVRWVESMALLALAFLLVPARIERPSDLLVLLFFFIPVVPTLSFYAMNGGERTYMYFAILTFLIIASARFGPTVRIPGLQHGRSMALSLCGLATLAVLAWLYASGGFSYFNLNILQVYDSREAASEAISVGIFGYLNQWTFRVFNVVLISWALYRRIYWLFVLLLALQIVFFGVSSEKKVLFVPVFVLLVYALSRLRYSTLLFGLGVCSVVVVSSAIAVYLDFSLVYSLFVRRLMFVPALLNFTYYDFFSSAGHVYLSSGPFSAFIDYPFREIAPRMVNYHLSGDTLGWANDGILGSSFMHFGFAGMIAYGLIAQLLIRLADALIVGKLPVWLGLSVIIVPFFNLFTGADLTTALGTHGLGIGLIMLWMLGSGLSQEVERGVRA